jgi:hypothetical protein
MSDYLVKRLDNLWCNAGGRRFLLQKPTDSSYLPRDRIEELEARAARRRWNIIQAYGEDDRLHPTIV